jgi:two-component system chemotaxis response regulator CheB
MPIKINNPFDSTTKLEVQPGEFYVSQDPILLTTILGSCVAVCIFDRNKKIGGMNHFLLPSPQSQPETHDNLNKYASHCIPALLKAFKNAGSAPADLDIKILGGANIFDGDQASFSSAVGRENIVAARKIVSSFGLTISGENVGGEQGRRIELNTQTGEIRFQKLHVMKTEQRKNVIKVLIVDDAKPLRMILRKIIDSTPGFKVIAEAESAQAAMIARKKEKPDVITLDINMPGMDGVTYLKQYMPVEPVPTVIVTSYSAADSPHILEALKHGAFDHLGKPTMENVKAYGELLIETLRAAYNNKGKVKLKNIPVKQLSFTASQTALEKTLIVIGSSTGGTEALRVVLKSFPKATPPILIVQHIPPVFSKTFAESLNETCAMRSKEAENGDLIEQGKIYVAAGGRHMRVVSTGTTMRIELTADPEVNKFRPSVDYMFDSVRNVMDKRKDLRVVAALLTGMGADGAEGLLSLRKGGAETIAQDEATSVVFGMPKEAINRGAAKHVVGITEVATKIVDCINKSSKPRSLG